jgi:ketosteroid isomerase-like protein
MKKATLIFLVLVLTCAVALAQQEPPARGGRGQRGPQVPPATGAMLDMANKIVEAINAQDAATLQKMMAPDAVYLDEDGHAPPVARWITALTTGTPAKKIAISSTHGQMFNDSGWVSFNYELQENFQGQPKTVRGTASLMLRKAASGDWQIQMMHGALYQKVAGLTQ